jgi:hypothetical protein
VIGGDGGGRGWAFLCRLRQLFSRESAKSAANSAIAEAYVSQNGGVLSPRVPKDKDI